MAIKRLLSPGEAQEFAGKFFGITLPVSLKDLKSAFRTKSKELHTDVGGDKEAFIAMKDAYENIVALHESYPELFSENGTSQFFETTDGTPLYELGLGLGPTINGKDCPLCSRKGYSEEFGEAWKVCKACDAFGFAPKISLCRPCMGTGRFVQKSGRKVSCRKCGGSGKFRHPYTLGLCAVCKGMKTILAKTQKVFYRKCFYCKGTGEVEVFNVVFPKGRLSG